MARIAFWRLGDSEAVQARRRKTWGTPGARWSAIGQRDVLSATGPRGQCLDAATWWLPGGYLVSAAIAAHKMPKIVLFRRGGP
ncbi:MAG: hypothetical protein KatS3mg038_3424 [Candidatus Kapaibacterium sp.]|nr:MAG: hypothetical protein KatS3mg038_3424 [Candidatus Kapabacteria bacterium]